MQNPLVSILIPLYNHENFVIQCLQSILLDDYKYKEIIIVDDFSKDDSFSVVLEWMESNNIVYPITLEKNTSNIGICRTFNRLVKLSKGKYIIPLASDDCLIPGSIEKRLKYLKINNDKMAVFGDCHVIDSQNNIVYDSSLEDLHAANINNFRTKNGMLREIILNWSVVGPSFLIDRRAYDKFGFYDERLKIEDWDFYLRLASRNMIGFVNTKVGLYRIHKNNVSRKKTFGKIDTEYELLKIAVKNLNNFHGKYRYLLMKKILVYIYLIFRKLSIP